MKYYFIYYLHRYNDQEWTHHNDVIDEHPFVWLNKWMHYKNHSAGPKLNSEYVLCEWKEITYTEFTFFDKYNDAMSDDFGAAPSKPPHTYSHWNAWFEFKAK